MKLDFYIIDDEKSVIGIYVTSDAEHAEGNAEERNTLVEFIW